MSERRRVLVVDDSPTVLSYVASILAPHFDVEVASDGAEGYRRIGERMPDAVILDLEMPEMNGVQMLSLLRSEERFRSLPVLISTTVTDVQQVNECRRLGCAGFVLKPLNGEYIVAKLRRLTAPGEAQPPAPSRLLAGT